MSQWTHVNGCIRIDGIPGYEPDVSSIMGRQAGWDDLLPSEGIPAGSEGSIRYQVLRVGTGCVLFTVPIWGDLRNFGASIAPEIDAWFTRIMTDLPVGSVRDAILRVDIEYGAQYVLVWQDGRVVRIELRA